MAFNLRGCGMDWNIVIEWTNRSHTEYSVLYNYLNLKVQPLRSIINSHVYS